MNRLILLGDSTCAIKERTARPETGWGEAFYPFLAPEWTILNYAKNGRSTRSCLNEGIFSEALMTAGDGDVAIIQFGHNDQKTDERGTEPFTGYAANLIYMATELRKKGADVYFVTSVPRRRFVNGKPVDSHKDYIAAMKWAGHQLSVPVVDITIPLMMDLAMLGDEKSRKYYMNFGRGEYPNFIDGKEDNTHLRPEGAIWVAKEIASGLEALGCSFIRK